LTIHLEILYIPWWHIQSRESWTTMSLFCVHLEFKSAIELDLPSHCWISTLYKRPYKQRYISYLQNATRNILPPHLFYQRSKPGFKVIVTLLIPMLEWSRCGDWKKYNELLYYIISRFLSSRNSIKTFDFSTIFHSKLKYILKELVQFCYIKKNS
jgi:hypothetical protein